MLCWLYQLFCSVNPPKLNKNVKLAITILCRTDQPKQNNTSTKWRIKQIFITRVHSARTTYIKKKTCVTTAGAGCQLTEIHFHWCTKFMHSPSSSSSCLTAATGCNISLLSRGSTKLDWTEWSSQKRAVKEGPRLES